MTVPSGRSDLFRRGLRRIDRVFATPAAPRSENDFATHMPVLIGLARLFLIERVLELGCGRFSTLTFLNRSAFPRLLGLDSLEDDPVWAQEVGELTGADPRFSLTRVEGTVAQAISDISFAPYDLVLVDDSGTMKQRARTIREVASRVGPSNLVLIHDFEVPAYREASSGFAKRFVFAALTPQTGALWNALHIDRRSMMWLQSRIRQHATRLDPADACGWMEVFGDPPRQQRQLRPE